MSQALTPEIHELIEAMRRVGSGERSVRVGSDAALPRHTDALARAFDDMAASLEAQHRQTARLATDLRALTARVESLQEEERSAIAIEIHDQIGQSLTALKLDLAWVDRRLAAGAPVETVRERIREMMSLVDATADRVHNLAMELRPDVLDRLGLPAALEWQARQFQQRTGITTTFETNVTAPVEPHRSTAMFRIAQEALTNVARHAEAAHAHMCLTVTDTDVTLEITDDGRGLDCERPRLGLLGMRERALAFGGEVTVVGPPGRGTRVTARLPLPVTSA